MNTKTKRALPQTKSACTRPSPKVDMSKQFHFQTLPFPNKTTPKQGQPPKCAHGQSQPLRCPKQGICQTSTYKAKSNKDRLATSSIMPFPLHTSPLSETTPLPLEQIASNPSHVNNDQSNGQHLVQLATQLHNDKQHAT